ncbi:glycerophosphodiester phosphodiesterase [Haloparvum sedimenti]|uniref:glycerophosphodiester phosphodiesterase n=1 Tax=Haloparvum sedimenti TaxID=1678448 RepID=UPI0009B5B687|nr:glycerophosphodiester phosphodiesterase [Haloparvum sedimenti]
MSDGNAAGTAAEGGNAGEDAGERVFAHRGCAGQYPENTVAAVRQAAPHVDAVEVDVRRCASGELVVLHDPDVSRVTDGIGSVAEMRYADLRGLEVLDSGEPVPRLSDLLAAAPDDLLVNVELKTAGLADAALRAADRAANPVLFSSFSTTALREVRETDPDARLAVLCSSDPDAALRTARAVDAEAVHPSLRLCTGTGVIAAAREEGLAVNGWTVETAADAETLRAAGVDGLITDRWDVV